MDLLGFRIRVPFGLINIYHFTNAWKLVGLLVGLKSFLSKTELVFPYSVATSIFKLGAFAWFVACYSLISRVVKPAHLEKSEMVDYFFHESLGLN